jgi:hypothetical protein
VIGIEVEAAATVNQSDFSGLHKLVEACGKRLGAAPVRMD